jgi:hypothetical protein
VALSNEIFCIRQIAEKKWEYSETVHQLFVDFKKACDSVRREVLYNRAHRVWGTHETSGLIGLIKMCLNETYNKVCVSKRFSDDNNIIIII